VVLADLPPEFHSWTFDGGTAVTRRDIAAPVREALAAAGTLHRWASQQPERDEFTGRGATYGVPLGGLRVVVRHAMRGGAIAPLLRDRYFGSPRFLTEIALAQRLAAVGVPTPAVLAGIRYAAPPGHRADVMTERVDGRDLAAIFFGDPAPDDAARRAVWVAVAATVVRLHAARLVHPDLQLRNVLVGPDPAAPGTLTAWLLDVDTCRPATGRNARRANVDRFYRSWDKWNRMHGERLTSADRKTFEAAYRAEAA